MARSFHRHLQNTWVACFNCLGFTRICTHYIRYFHIFHPYIPCFQHTRFLRFWPVLYNNRWAWGGVPDRIIETFEETNINWLGYAKLGNQTFATFETTTSADSTLFPTQTRISYICNVHVLHNQALGVRNIKTHTWSTHHKP